MARNADGLGRKPHKWRGRWRAYLTIGYKLNGDPDRVYVYGKTESECLERLDALRRRHGRGGQVGGDLTVQAYVGEWLAGLEGRVSPRTHEEYERELGHLMPNIGRIKLSRLSVSDIERAMNAIEGAKVTIGSGKFSYESQLTARAANQARGILKNALEDAVRQGRIEWNPAESARRLRHEKKEHTVWTAAEIMAFLNETLKGNAAHYALYYVALTTGLRAGELIALTWPDLDGVHLRVRRTITRFKGKYSEGRPKSKASNRIVKLSLDTVDVLDRHKLALEEAGLLDSLVFPSGKGTRLTHSGLRSNLRAWAKKAGVKPIRLHDLRHTYASMAISAGMSAADLARQLGHVDSAFTMRTYVHFFDRVAPREAPELARLLGFPQGGIGGGTGADEIVGRKVN